MNPGYELLRTEGPPWWQVFAVNRHLMYLEGERRREPEENRGRPSGDFHAPDRVAWRRRKMAMLRKRHGG